MKRKKLLEEFPDSELLFADGFDEAIVGVDFVADRVVYSISKSLNVLMQTNELSEDDAWEHLMYNVIGSYVGAKTPIWTYDIYD